MVGTLTVDEAVGSIVTLQRNDGNAERCVVGGGGSVAPLKPQPRALQILQIIDPQNVTGVATNSGAQKATVTGADGNPYTGPVWLAWADLVAAWGTTSPVLSSPTRIVFASSHTDGFDPVICTPILFDTVVGLTFMGSATAPTPTQITAVVAKNRAAGANSALKAVGPTAVGQFIQNTTRVGKSVAWVLRTVSGAVHLLSQPFIPTAPVGNPAPAEDDTWVTNDAVNLIEPTAICFVHLAPTNASDTLANGEINVYGCVAFDPSGTPGSGLFTVDCSGGPVNFVQVRCDTAFSLSGDLPAEPAFFATNCFFQGGFALGSGAVCIGGAVDCGAPGGAVVSSQTLSTVFDGDFLFTTSVPNFGPTFGSNNGGTQFGSVCLDTRGGMSQVAVGNLLCGAPFFYATAIVYCSSTAGDANNLNVVGSARLVNLPPHTFAQTFTYPLAITTGIGLNGGTQASSEDGGTPTVINGGIQTTVVNLDAAVGIGSFGGKAFLLGGGSITNFL